jgi:hypothetical protein
MITMRISIKDGTDLQGKSTRIRQQLIGANRELAEFIKDRAQFYAPFKTGKLERGILVKFVGKDKMVVSSLSPYSGYQEYGVPPILNYRFIPASGTGRTGEGFMKWGRGPDFKHPGIPKREFMRRAGEDGRREAKKIYGKRIKLAISRRNK